MPKRRSISKSLPKGITRQHRGGSLYAPAWDERTGRIARRNTGTKDVAEAVRLRDEWAADIAARQMRSSGPLRTPTQYVAEYISLKRHSPRKRSEAHLQATERLLLEFVVDAKLERIEDITLELVSRTLDWRERNPKSRRKPGGETDRRELSRWQRDCEEAEGEGRPLPPRPTKAIAQLSSSSMLHRQTAIKSWVGWLVRRQYLLRYPLDGMDAPQRKLVRPFGAVLLEEYHRLVVGTASLGPVFGVPAVDRQAIWIAAWSTGMRLAELLSTRVRDWELEPRGGVSLVRLQHTKDYRDSAGSTPGDKPQLVLDLWIDELIRYFAGRDPNEPAFHERFNKDRAAKLLRRDLESLGIPTEDRFGRRVFHSIRGSVLSWLASCGLSEVELRRFSRHKSIATTERHYLKIQVETLAKRIVDSTGSARNPLAFIPAPSGTVRHPIGDSDRVPTSQSEERNTMDAQAFGTVQHRPAPLHEEPPAGLEPATSRLQTIREACSPPDYESGDSRHLRAAAEGGARNQLAISTAPTGTDGTRFASEDAAAQIDRVVAPIDLTMAAAAAEDAVRRGLAALDVIATELAVDRTPAAHAATDTN